MIGRRLDLNAFNEWVTRNRLLLWWGILTPLFILALILAYPQLKIEPSEIKTAPSDLWVAILNTAPLLFLFRLVALAFGLVLLLIGFFLPTLRVGKEGVSWEHEIEDRLADVAAEYAGDEVERIVRDEQNRWEAILYWLKLDATGQDPAMLMHGFIATLRDRFAGDHLVLQVTGDLETNLIAHPLYEFLATEFGEEVEPGQRIGAEIHLPREDWLLVLETRQNEGYSTLDQDFLWSMANIFERLLIQAEIPELSPKLTGFSLMEANIDRGEGI